jgi:NAD(P)H-dependent FMN reductase
MAAKILAFAGSSRSGSLSRKILGLAVRAARTRGAAVTEIDLRAFDLPIYDGDLEQRDGLPPGAARLHAIFKAHAALLIGVTEYNGGVTPEAAFDGDEPKDPAVLAFTDVVADRLVGLVERLG